MRTRRVGWWVGLVMAAAAGIPGCQLVGAIGANAEHTGSHRVEAQIVALEGKSFAVLVLAGRSIQGEYPSLVDHLTQKITERLAKPEAAPRAAGYVPPADVLRYTNNTPGWALKSKEELGRALGGVERLVVVEVIEYRLTDPGNRYVWEGVASGTVSVYDATGPGSELALTEKATSARFPDSLGHVDEEMSGQVVNSALAARFVDRVSWLFTAHDEPNDIKY